jgi:two-component sensor histidine kinase
MIRLTDEQWERIRDHFPEENIGGGRPGRKPTPVHSNPFSSNPRTSPAITSEAMRKALEKAVAAERSAEVLLYELNHRIRNNFAMVASVLELQKRSVKEQAAKDAFASAVARVHVIANAHDHLLPKEGQSLIDMREYLTVCCQNLGDALRDVRPIAVNVRAAQILLREDRAVSIGLIVNELVTNAFKYAFPDDRGGVVNVILHRVSDGKLELVVEDNGKGCPQDAKEGLGSRIVRLLAQQLEVQSHARQQIPDAECR